MSSDESRERERRADGGESHRDETTTEKNGRGANRERNLFLTNRHPELFEITPRPGGYLPHLAARRNSSSIVDKTPDKPKSSTSGTTKVGTLGRASIGEILETSIRCPSARRPVSKIDKKDNTVRMCSIAISTVMMLAQHIYVDITPEHVHHTEEYFRGLRQPDGYPHNVGQLAVLLSNLKASGRIVASYIEEEEQDEAEDEAQQREDTDRDKREEETSDLTN